MRVEVTSRQSPPTASASRWRATTPPASASRSSSSSIAGGPGSRWWSRPCRRASDYIRWAPDGASLEFRRQSAGAVRAGLELPAAAEQHGQGPEPAVDSARAGRRWGRERRRRECPVRLAGLIARWDRSRLRGREQCSADDGERRRRPGAWGLHPGDQSNGVRLARRGESAPPRGGQHPPPAGQPRPLLAGRRMRLSRAPIASRRRYGLRMEHGWRPSGVRAPRRASCGC